MWKAPGTVHQTQQPPLPLTSFARQFSGKSAKFARGELMGSGGFSSASLVFAKQPELTQGAGPSSGGAKNLSTSTADFRRGLRVTEPRVTNNKRKLSDLDGQNTMANRNVKKPETFNRDAQGYIIVYTDGACKENGRKGAEAGIGVWFGDNHEL
jgi:hypothetical protein